MKLDSNMQEINKNILNELDKYATRAEIAHLQKNTPTKDSVEKLKMEMKMTATNQEM